MKWTCPQCHAKLGPMLVIDFLNLYTVLNLTGDTLLIKSYVSYGRGGEWGRGPQEGRGGRGGLKGTWRPWGNELPTGSEMAMEDRDLIKFFSDLSAIF